MESKTDLKLREDFRIFEGHINELLFLSKNNSSDWNWRDKTLR